MQDAAEAFVRAKDRIDREGRSKVSGIWWERFLRKIRGYQPPKELGQLYIQVNLLCRHSLFL